MVGAVIGGADAHRQPLGKGQPLVRPDAPALVVGTAGGRRIDVDCAVDVVEQRHEHPVTGHLSVVDGLGGAGHEHQLGGAGLRVESHQRAGVEGRVTGIGGPGFVRGHDQPLADVAVDFALAWYLQSGRGSVGVQFQLLGREEADAAADQHERDLAVRVAEHPARCAHIRGLAAMNTAPA